LFPIRFDDIIGHVRGISLDLIQIM